MMLPKLMATLATSISAAAMRSTDISRWAARRSMVCIGVPLALRIIVLVLRRRRPHHLQHVVDGGCVLGGLVGHRPEQRLQLGLVVRRQPLDVAAERRPVAFEFFVEVGFPGLGLGLYWHGRRQYRFL